MNYLKIESSSLSNGTGWRVVLWVSGCNHGCFNCHNRESWSPTSGKPYTDTEQQKKSIYKRFNTIGGRSTASM